jgi:prefoldin subunit 5
MAQYQMTEQQIIDTVKQYDNAIQKKVASAKRIERVAMEVKETIASLQEIEKINGPVLVKLGAGVYIEVEAKNVKTCKRGISQDAFIEDKIPEAIKWLENKQKILEKNLIAEKQDALKLEQSLTEMVSIVKQIESEKQKNFSRK